MSTNKGVRGMCAIAAAAGMLGAGGVGAVASPVGSSSVMDDATQYESERVIVGSDGSISSADPMTSAATKQCVGHYKHGNKPCSAGSISMAFEDETSCQKHGQHLMATVHKKVNGGRIGYYTFGCTKVRDDAYMLKMAGFVKVFDTNSTHLR